MNNAVLLDGRLDWELINRRGRVVDKGEQHNMFLNQGLDQLAQFGSFDSCMGVALVSDGAGVPAVTDTAMDGAVSASSTNFPATGLTVTRIADGVYRLTISKFFDYNQGNGDLTQWGFKPNAVGAGVSIKERFLDGQGNPRVVTKDSNFTLRLNYTLDVTLAPVTEQAGNFNIPGLGTINTRRVLKQQFPGYRDRTDFALANYMLSGDLTAVFTPSPAPALLIYTGNEAIQGAPGAVGSSGSAPYVPGSFRRVFSLSVGATQSDVTFERVLLGDPNSIFGNIATGMILALDTPITKLASKALTLTGITFSWGRA
jgi:hypothetical protein